MEICLSDRQNLIFDFYGENIFRVFQDKNGGIIREPEAKPAARILVDQPRKPVSGLEITQDGNQVTITTGKIKIELDKKSPLMKVTNRTTNRVVMEEIAPAQFEEKKVTLTLKENPQEYFYGGGVQNLSLIHI